MRALEKDKILPARMLGAQAANHLVSLVSVLGKEDPHDPRLILAWIGWAAGTTDQGLDQTVHLLIPATHCDQCINVLTTAVSTDLLVQLLPSIAQLKHDPQDGYPIDRTVGSPPGGQSV